MSIVLEHVTKAYHQQPVVDDISLDIRKGELFVLLGASGSGKSTLLRMIAGLNTVDQGRILVHGREVTHLTPQQREVGFVFQNYSLFKHMTVAQNIAFGLELRKVPTQQRQARVQELLTMIGLEGLDQRLPSQLSGGQQQRVALARAIAYEPGVLLLDEPFGALDVKIRAQLRQRLREIQQSLQITTVLVTHDQEEAFELADRIGIIDRGRLLEIGTPSALYRRPQTRFTATFLGVANLLPAHRNSTEVHVGTTRLAAPLHTEHLSNQEVEILVRPEEVEIACDSDSIRGQVLGQGHVQQIGFAGPMERLSVRLADERLPLVQVLLSANEVERLGIREQSSVWVGLRDYSLISPHPSDVAVAHSEA